MNGNERRFDYLIWLTYVFFFVLSQLFMSFHFLCVQISLFYLACFTSVYMQLLLLVRVFILYTFYFIRTSLSLTYYTFISQSCFYKCLLFFSRVDTGLINVIFVLITVMAFMNFAFCLCQKHRLCVIM